MQEFNIRQVRELKGPALSVLVLLAASHLPVSNEWLEDTSGYSDKLVSGALSYLENTGRAVHAPSGWTITQMNFRLLETIEPLQDHDRNIGEFQLVAKGKCLEYLPPAGEKELMKRRFSESESETFECRYEESHKCVETLSTGRQEIWAEMHLLGLRKNKRTEALLKMEHISADYIRALAVKLKQEGLGGARHTGLFIKACEQAEQVDMSQLTIEEAVAKFLGHGS